jgi:uncharacterized damage-inducible protein DinB
MNWTEYLRTEIEATYSASLALIDKVDADQLDWKPSEGLNWMTTGQLLQHMTDACGVLCRGFVTGEFPFEDFENLPPEKMIPPAEAMPTAESIAAVKEALEKDKRMALGSIAEASEERLANEQTKAPWDPNEMVLGQRLAHMVGHLNQHKGQLFYYLKLQGKPVNTMDLYE